MTAVGRILAAVTLLLATASVARADEVVRLVLVVGNNRPAEANQTPLRFADDDAIRFHERFEGLADSRILLTRLDDSTRPLSVLYPALTPPTRQAVATATLQLRAQAAAFKAQGRFVEVVFVFAGHGGLHGGEPYLALEDGRLGLRALEQMVLADSPADVIHVLIDACHAAGFVERRGPLRGDREPLAEDTLPFGRLVERYPHAGFVVAASASGAAFEWSRFGSGVASHLIRSALSGAADRAPPDGRVTYDELDAFLRTATAGIVPTEYQQQIRVLAPRALPSAAIVDLPARERTTELSVDRPGRWYVRDADGNRIVDLHHGRGAVRLLLPPYSQRFALVEVRERGPGCAGPGRRRQEGCSREESTYEFPAGGARRASELTTAASATVAARGLIEDSVFEELLARPYDETSLSLRPAPRLVAPAPAPIEAVPGRAIGVGYRGMLGDSIHGIGILHGLELRLDLPLGRRLRLTPLLGAGRALATVPDEPTYPIYQLDAGLEASVVVLSAPAEIGLGVEARVQGVEQAIDRDDERHGLLGSMGAIARLWWPLGRVVDVGGVAAGGLQLGRVDEELRVTPDVALHLGT